MLVAWGLYDGCSSGSLYVSARVHVLTWYVKHTGGSVHRAISCWRTVKNSLESVWWFTLPPSADTHFYFRTFWPLYSIDNLYHFSLSGSHITASHMVLIVYPPWTRMLNIQVCLLALWIPCSVCLCPLSIFRLVDGLFGPFERGWIFCCYVTVSLTSEFLSDPSYTC